MTACTYPKNDAIARIKDILDQYVNDYDLGSIFDAIYSYDEKLGGFVEDEDADFWGIADEYDTTMAKAAGLTRYNVLTSKCGDWYIVPLDEMGRLI